jgi:hypothetical protein
MPGTGPATSELPAARRYGVTDGLLFVGVEFLFVDVNPPDGECHSRRQEVDQGFPKGLRVKATVG